MKRDMDLVREILLKAETREKVSTGDLLGLVEPTEEGAKKLAYHLEMLTQQAKFLGGNAHWTHGVGPNHDEARREWYALDLTWAGHEFLDAVRDPEIWRKTKEGANKVGNWALDFVVELAKGYAKQKAKEMLGIDLGND